MKTHSCLSGSQENTLRERDRHAEINVAKCTKNGIIAFLFLDCLGQMESFIKTETHVCNHFKLFNNKHMCRYYKLHFYIFRSISHRKFYKTSGSGSENYITTATHTTDDTFLADDYGTPTGNTNSSCDADFLADMFDRTTQVYHHRLRYVCGIHKMCHNLCNR
jgi:hypothetical protein